MYGQPWVSRSVQVEPTFEKSGCFNCATLQPHTDYLYWTQATLYQRAQVMHTVYDYFHFSAKWGPLAQQKMENENYVWEPGKDGIDHDEISTTGPNSHQGKSFDQNISSLEGKSHQRKDVHVHLGKGRHSSKEIMFIWRVSLPNLLHCTRFLCSCSSCRCTSLAWASSS